MMSEVCCQNDITDETKDFFVVLKGKANNDLLIKWNGAAISSLECMFFLLESIFEKVRGFLVVVFNHQMT